METQMIDPKRQAVLDKMAKARAARAANLARAAAQTPPPAKPVKRAKRPGRVKLALAMEREKQTKAELKAAKKMETNLFAGIGHQPYGCPRACTEKHCVISGEGICQHPDGGNVQEKYQRMGYESVRERFAQARLYLQQLDTERAKKG